MDKPHFYEEDDKFMSGSKLLIENEIRRFGKERDLTCMDMCLRFMADLNCQQKFIHWIFMNAACEEIRETMISVFSDILEDPGIIEVHNENITLLEDIEKKLTQYFTDRRINGKKQEKSER